MKTNKDVNGLETGQSGGLEAGNHGFAFTHTGGQTSHHGQDQGKGQGEVKARVIADDDYDEFTAVQVPWKNVVKGSRLVNYRKPHDTMAAELDALLAQPYPRASLIFILDKIERLGSDGTGSDGDTAARFPDILNQGTTEATQMPGAIMELLLKAVKDGLLVKARLPVKERTLTFTLQDKGRRLLDKARQARLALWKVNPRMDVDRVCAIIELEEDDCVELYLSQIVETAATTAVAQVFPRIQPATGEKRAQPQRPVGGHLLLAPGPARQRRAQQKCQMNSERPALDRPVTRATLFLMNKENSMGNYPTVERRAAFDL